MSDLEIFVIGTFITILVAIALVPLLWAAVLDGRDEEAASRRAAERRHGEPIAAPHEN